MLYMCCYIREREWDRRDIRPVTDIYYDLFGHNYDSY